MSRCFPYPPPGYERIPVAVAVAEAETTAKLQKEREKAEKKKEKRSDKKALQQGETSKHSKHGHKKRKHEDVSTAVQEPRKVSKESTEQLEKSGLSEEHGAPCFIQTVWDSPESSQDSSKRRKVVLPSPSQAKNGNILRIKIKSSQDSQAAVLEKPMVLEQSLVQQIGSGSLLSKQNSIQHHSKMNGRSAAAPQRINSDSQSVQKRVITEPTAKIMQRVAPQPAVKVNQPVEPQLSVKATVGRSDLLPPKFLGSAGPSPARVAGRSGPQPPKMPQIVQCPPAKILLKDTQLSSEEVQRKSPAVTKVAQKEFRSPAVRVPEAPQLPVLQEPKDLPVLKQQQEPITSLPKEEPCFSGRNAEAAPVQEAKLSRSDRKKIHKAEKKEKKYRDLFVTWNPVSIEMEGSDLGEQDWLLGGGTRNSDASMTCRASDSSVPFQSVEQQLLLQPRATLLPDLHMYQLPYVVPF